VIVGHQVAEALGDAAQFESQRNLPEAKDDRAFNGDGRMMTIRVTVEQNRRPTASGTRGRAAAEMLPTG
jgi:hypothetical protein